MLGEFNSVHARSRLNELLRERALRVGDFTLRSGARSTFYLDCRQVTLHPEGAYLVAMLILARLRHLRVAAVGGPALAAVPMVGAICALSFAEGRPLAGFVVRKEAKDHGMGNLIEGPLPPGASVAVVEDTLTTGGELLRAAQAVREQGNVVSAAFCIVDRGEGALATLHEHGIAAEALFTLEDLGIRRA